MIISEKITGNDILIIGDDFEKDNIGIKSVLNNYIDNTKLSRDNCGWISSNLREYINDLIERGVLKNIDINDIKTIRGGFKVDNLNLSDKSDARYFGKKYLNVISKSDDTDKENPYSSKNIKWFFNTFLRNNYPDIFDDWCHIPHTYLKYKNTIIDPSYKMFLKGMDKPMNITKDNYLDVNYSEITPKSDINESLNESDVNDFDSNLIINEIENQLTDALKKRYKNLAIDFDDEYNDGSRFRVNVILYNRGKILTNRYFNIYNDSYFDLVGDVSSFVDKIKYQIKHPEYEIEKLLDPTCGHDKPLTEAKAEDFGLEDAAWVVPNFNEFKEKVGGTVDDYKEFLKDLYGFTEEHFNDPDIQDYLFANLTDNERNELAKILFRKQMGFDESVDLTEAKADQQKFIDKFGQENFDKFVKYKQRLKNKNISTDILWHVKNTEKGDMDSIISELDNTLSKTQKAKEDVVNGADLIYKDDNWKVYHVHTYDAAAKLGSGTTWCITGRYGGATDQGEYYFNRYVSRYGLDDYYFIFDLNNRDNTTGDYLKYCAGVTKDPRKLVFLFNGMQDRDIKDDGIPGVPRENRIQPISGIRIPYNSIELINGCRIKDDKIVSAGDAYGDIVLPDYITEIPEGAFYNSRIQSIVVPDSVTIIGEKAFADCQNLKSVKLPKSIKKIEHATFFLCESLEEVVIPEGIETIDSQAFMDCGSLKQLNLPSSLRTIWYEAFAYCTGLENVIIPEGVLNIKNNAFKNCVLNTLTLPRSLQTFVKSDCQIDEIIYNGSREDWLGVRTNYKGPITFTGGSSDEEIGESLHEDYAVGYLYGNTIVAQGKEKRAMKSYGVDVSDPENKSFKSKPGTKKVVISGDRDKIIDMFNDLYMVPENEIVWCEWDGSSTKAPKHVPSAIKKNINKVKDNKDLLKDPEFKKYYDQFKDQEYHSLIYLKGDTNKEFKELSSRKDIDIHFVTWRGYNQRDDLGKRFVVSGTWDNIVNLFKERGEPVRWCERNGQPFEGRNVVVYSPYDMAKAYMEIDAPKKYKNRIPSDNFEDWVAKRGMNMDDLLDNPDLYDYFENEFNSLHEDWYDDDQFFTRDDLSEYVEEPLETIIKLHWKDFNLRRAYIEPGNILEVDWEYKDYEDTSKVKIDMRSIRKPVDLCKYGMKIMHIILDKIKKIDPELGESLTEANNDTAISMSDLDRIDFLKHELDYFAYCEAIKPLSDEDKALQDKYMKELFKLGKKYNLKFTWNLPSSWYKNESLGESNTMDKVTKFHKTPYGFSEADYRGFTITWYDDYVPYGNYDEPYSVDWFGDESFYETVKDAKRDIDKYLEQNESLNESDSEEESRFERIKGKSVMDTDGFYTDYTMYYDTLLDKYVFVFGDEELYSPGSGNFDWECDSEQEANEWFNDYNGYDEYEEERAWLDDMVDQEGKKESISEDFDSELGKNYIGKTVFIKLKDGSRLIRKVLEQGNRARGHEVLVVEDPINNSKMINVDDIASIRRPYESDSERGPVEKNNWSDTFNSLL